MRHNTYQVRSKLVLKTARPWILLATVSVLLAGVSVVPSIKSSRRRRLDEWDWSFLSETEQQQQQDESSTKVSAANDKDGDWNFIESTSPRHEVSPVTPSNTLTDDWDTPTTPAKTTTTDDDDDDDWNVVTDSSTSTANHHQPAAIAEDEWGFAEITQSTTSEKKTSGGMEVNDDDWNIMGQEKAPLPPSSSPKGITDDDEGEWFLINDVTKISYTAKSSSEHAHSSKSHKHHHSVFTEDHKDLFPFNWADFWGFALATGGLLLAAGGGIGGGGILVPIYCLVLDFSPKHAIPLSNITVLGGALANTILNAPKRHPSADRPLIDWDMILVMEPLTIAGALVGALINKVLPELLLTVLLVLLLAITAQNTLSKAIQLYRKETAQMIQESELTKLVEEQQRNDDDGDEEDDDDENKDAKGDEPNESQMVTVMSKEHEELQAILEHERHHSQHNIILLVVMFIVVLIINASKGGGAFKSPLGITCGSSAFWMSNFLLLAWILAISIHARVVLLHKYERKAACNYVYQPGDIVWDERATVVYPIICTFAGFFAGMFGVGGGIVKGPLMLAMGIHPAVSSASTACMILFTSFTATTSFVVFGLLVYDYAIICFIIGFLATLVGQIALSYVMKRAGRNSYIAFSIGGVVLVSAILMTIQSLLSIAEGEKHHAGGICGKGD
ncbi:hypothetical protein FisN_21Lh114 [Fistulifera solaris]|uniref:Sulfite exporter TauE/SafE n=1 Tax=Fistulifera solaris TaxID=1519565 RepID=A0A1Z5J8V8_FISSO|nr:hypothetical protein FisN_21Lh114 [Fistulifera solaris]|eukprot:GAX10417.1 hypothetical protein FisN_21Lh114 [Fistulifera solaris]